MIKADIVKKVTEKLGTESNQFRDKESLVVVDQIIEAMKEIIVRDGRLEIRDFGVFQVKERKARIGRNPKNLKRYPIPSHKVVTFKPGKNIKTIDLDGESKG